MVLAIAFKWMRFKMLKKEPSFLIVWASEVTASSSAVFGCSLCRRPRPALHSQAFTSYADFTDYFMEKTERSFYITCSFNSKLFRCFFLRAFFLAPHQWVYKIVLSAPQSCHPGPSSIAFFLLRNGLASKHKLYIAFHHIAWETSLPKTSP